MRKKLLQNTLFAAMAAWALYGLQVSARASMADARSSYHWVALQR